MPRSHLCFYLNFQLTHAQHFPMPLFAISMFFGHVSVKPVHFN